jgi:uncharacterized protein YeaO (DUF488 family)
MWQLRRVQALKGNSLLRTKRAYESAEVSDGVRFLVDRLWPRGIKKERLEMKAWLKDVAPSPELRKWFAHDPDKWQEFQRRYRAELKANPETWKPILEAAKQGDVTLLYSARDTEHNSALLLKEFLEEHM